MRIPSVRKFVVFRFLWLIFTESLSTAYLRLGSHITSHSEIYVVGHKMAFCWRFVILLLLLIIFEIGFGVRRYLNEPEVTRAVRC